MSDPPGLAAARDALFSPDLPRARRLCRELLHQAPENPDALHLSGLLACAEENPQQGLSFFERALAADPVHALSHFDRANLLQRLQNHEEALKAYDVLIELRPQSADARCNRGAALASLNRLDEALESFNQAITLRADHAGAHFSRAVLWLLQGRLREGFAEYEWRWRTAPGQDVAARWRFPDAHWFGKESLAGKSLMVFAERGLGDSLQFCRYLPKLAELGARVYLQVQTPLVELLRPLSGVAGVCADPNEAPACDRHTPLLSLPLALGTELHCIPNEPYLKAPEDRVALFCKLLAHALSPRIGLVWRGDGANPDDVRRSILLPMLLKHLPANLRYVALQFDLTPQEHVLIEGSSLSIESLPRLDFIDTAALCENLDLMLCVDTSSAHLSGALGRPTWLMIPFHPDCRWLLNRSDSPWYPSMKLYRQPAPGNWDDVLVKVRADLLRRFAP